MDQEIEVVDVVIIGAGAAGLTTAHKLLQNNPSLKVVILEAKDRLGGRLFSTKLQTANGEDEFDMGGQWVSSRQHYIMDLIKELGLETYAQKVEGKSSVVMYDYSDIRTDSGLFPDIGIGNLIDLSNVISKINSLAKTFSTENPLSNNHAQEWDSQTVESFVNKHAKFATTKRIIDVLIRSLFGAETSQVSFFFFLSGIAELGSFDAIMDTGSGSAQEFVVKGTMCGIFKKLAEIIGLEKLKFDDPVVSICQANQTTVEVSTLKGQKYQTQYVVCAVPPHLVSKIHFSPPLPFNREQLSQRMPIGSIIKVFAVYKRAFWKDNGSSGVSFMLLRPNGEGCISATADATTPNGTPALVGFIGGKQAFYWTQKSKEERKKACMEYFVSVFGKEAETELVTYEDFDWNKVDYNGGCPGSVMGPGCSVYFEHALKEPFDRVHFAGTETSRKWIGYVEGAVESGIRVVGEIEARMKNPEKPASSDIDAVSPIFEKKDTSNKNCIIQ